MSKPKKCAVCEEEFTKTRPMQTVCGPMCAIEYQQILKEKKLKKKHAKQKREFKEQDKSHQMKLAQANFNKFIRLRDARDPCISCQRHHKGQYHCGHYRSVGAHPELRFNEFNCSKQCAPCNSYLSGNIVDYRINLIKKIGADRVAELEGPQASVKRTVEDIIEIKKHYAAKCRELEKAES